MTSSNAAPSLEGFVNSALHRSWWLLLLRGIAAVAFGVLTFVWPQISLLTLIMVYGIYALADGILALIAAIRGGGMVPRWWLALGGGGFVTLAAWAEADPVLGLGGLAAALAVWIGQRAGPRRGARGLEPRPDTPLAEMVRKLP